MKKSNMYLVGIFAVLLIITILVLNKQTGNYSTNEISEKFVLSDSAQIDKIEIQKNKQLIILEKNAGEWKITTPINYPAEKEMVWRVISVLKSGKFTTSVSSNPEKQSLYQVDTSGTKVTIYEKGTKRDIFIIGKPGSDYMSTFIRKENSKEVFLVDKAISYEFGKPLKDWRDKSIYRTPISAITEVKCEYGDTVFSLKKNQNSWFIDSDSIKINAVEPFLNAISSINADDFVDSTIILPTKTAARFTVSTTYQEDIRLYYNSGISGNYLVQSSKSPQVFVMEKYTANNLMKRKKDFLK
jgi:hypothetical protein